MYCARHREQGIKEYQQRMLPDVALENMEGYDGTVLDRYNEAHREFMKMDYPFLKEIAANADKPFIMNIKPKKHTNAESHFENMMGRDGIEIDRMLNEDCKKLSEMVS